MRRLTIMFLALTGCVESSEGEFTAQPAGTGGKSDSGSCAEFAWKKEVIASGDVGTYSTYRIEAGGTEHVLFHDDANSHMVYATRAAGGSAWKRIDIGCASVASSDRGDASNQNMQIGDDGTVYVMCSAPDTGSFQWEGNVPVRPVAGAVFERAPGANRFTQLDLAYEAPMWVGATRFPTIASSVAKAPDGTIFAVTVSELRDQYSYFGQTTRLWKKGPGGFAVTATMGGGSDGTGVKGSSVAMCIGDDGVRLSGAFQKPNGLVTFDEYRTNAAATAFTKAATMLSFDPSTYVNTVGYEPTCAIDGEGRTFHAGYDINSQELYLLRKGAGDAIVKFHEQGEYPSLATRGSDLFLSYGHEDALRLYWVVDGNGWYEDVDVDGVGEYTSLAIGPDGAPRIAYYDRGEARLKLATASCQ
jgi:hypothetical protein